MIEKPLPSRHRLNESGVIPMINIIFLLLIFFMLVAQIDQYPDLEHPVSSSENSLAENSVEIVINEAGQLTVDGVNPGVDLAKHMQSLQLVDGTIVMSHVHSQLPAAALDPVIAAMRSLPGLKLQIVTQLPE
ncbi:MAG: ExbD/TolR family protein [Granulosicoccus sp.]